MNVAFLDGQQLMTAECTKSVAGQVFAPTDEHYWSPNRLPINSVRPHVASFTELTSNALRLQPQRSNSSAPAGLGQLSPDFNIGSSIGTQAMKEIFHLQHRVLNWDSHLVARVEKPLTCESFAWKHTPAENIEFSTNGYRFYRSSEGMRRGHTLVYQWLTDVQNCRTRLTDECVWYGLLFR